MSITADRLVAREGVSAAIYVALVLFSGLVAVPRSSLPADSTMVKLIYGGAAGLVAAHWLAFRLAGHLVEGGVWTSTASREARAQFLGAMAAATLGAVPFLVLDGKNAVVTSLVLLSAVPGVAGAAIAHQRGHPWHGILAWSVGVFLLGQCVVALKVWLIH